MLRSLRNGNSPARVDTAQSGSDLLSAVLAGRHRLTLIHYDADFDIAAQVIDVDTRWVADRGTID